MYRINNNISTLFRVRLLSTLLIILFSRCTPKDKIITENSASSTSLKGEKVEMKRFSKVKLAEDFDEPMEMAITEEGKVIIIERKGTIKLYSPQSHSIKQIGSLNVYTGQEDGLLGVALDPDYARNPYVYFYYSPAGLTPMQRVSRFTMQGDSLLLNSEKRLIEIPTQRQECCHSAGSIAFGPDGNLFIAVGDNTNPHNPATIILLMNAKAAKTGMPSGQQAIPTTCVERFYESTRRQMAVTPYLQEIFFPKAQKTPVRKSM